MKKKALFILLFALALCVGAVLFAVLRNRAPQIGSFDLGDYRTQAEQFASDRNVGAISDTEDLLKKAEEVWVEIYGESVRDEKPYQIAWDEASGVWKLSGTLHPRFALGGTAQILIENDTGRVLAVWHEK